MPSIVKDTNTHCWWECQLVYLFGNLFRRTKLTKAEHRHTHNQTEAISLPVYRERNVYMYALKDMDKFGHNSPIRSSDFPTQHTQEHIMKDFQ